jgi:hypothetical protein
MVDVASVFPWDTVVDMSNLPLSADSSRAHSDRPGKVDALRATIRSARMIRNQFATATQKGTHPRKAAGTVDEVYLTCLDHPDVLLFATVFARAKVFAYPHTFDSLHSSELIAYGPHVSSCADQIGRRDQSVDALKRILLGADAQPVRSITVDGVYTFNEEPSWACDVVQLRGRVTKDAVRDLFDRLPERRRTAVARSATQTTPPVGVLLLAAPDLLKTHRSIELQGYAVLAKRMAHDLGCRSILLKAHPRTSTEQMDEALRAVTSAAPVPVIGLEEWRLPIELLAASFNIGACVGVGTTATQTLARVFDVHAYCPNDLLKAMWVVDSATEQAYAEWIGSNQIHYKDLPALNAERPS